MFNERRYGKLHDLNPSSICCAWCGDVLLGRTYPIRRYKFTRACSKLCACSAEIYLDYKKLREFVWIRHNKRCPFCFSTTALTRAQARETGYPLVHLHHVLPIRGSAEPVEAISRRSPGNTLPLCEFCHREQHRRIVSDKS